MSRLERERKRRKALRMFLKNIDKARDGAKRNEGLGLGALADALKPVKAQAARELDDAEFFVSALEAGPGPDGVERDGS